METTFSVGDYVGILEGTEKGHIIKIEKNKAWIETDHGFEITSPISQLVRYKAKKKPRKITSAKQPETTTTIPKTEDPFTQLKKNVIKKVKDDAFYVHPSLLGESKKPKSKKHQESIWEIDLHIEELVDHYRHLSNGEIVSIQLQHARSIIERAREYKVSKIVFIHGKGKGTLRNELTHLLSGYTFLEFYDASYQLYGGGATEVKIFTSKA